MPPELGSGSLPRGKEVHKIRSFQTQSITPVLLLPLIQSRQLGWQERVIPEQPSGQSQFATSIMASPPSSTLRVADKCGSACLPGTATALQLLQASYSDLCILTYYYYYYLMEIVVSLLRGTVRIE